MQSPIYDLRNRTVNSKLPSVRDNFLQLSSSSPCHQTSVATPTTFERPFTTGAVGTSVSHVFCHSQPFLKFSTDDDSLWFTRFEEKYHNSNLDDRQLYFELIKCLNDYQLQKVSTLLSTAEDCWSTFKHKQICINYYNVQMNKNDK